MAQAIFVLGCEANLVADDTRHDECESSILVHLDDHLSRNHFCDYCLTWLFLYVFT